MSANVDHSKHFPKDYLPGTNVNARWALQYLVRALPTYRAIVKAEEAASASVKAEEGKKGDFDTTFRQVAYLARSSWAACLSGTTMILVESTV